MRRLFASPSAPLVACLLGLGAMMFLALLWYSFSPILGRVYSAVRIAESGGLWLLTDWGTYFTTWPKGESYAFIALYKSSVPFGLVFAAVTGLIGVLAYRKVRTQHLGVLMGEPADGSTAEGAVRSLYGSLPHLRIEAFDLPTTPLRLPSRNPFAAVLDLRDRAQVSGAVTGLSWPEAAVLVLVIDAIAPMKNRKPIQLVSATAWETTRMPASRKRWAGEPQNCLEPSNRDRTMLMLTLIDVVTRMDDRDTAALDEAHDIMQEATNTHVMLCNLVMRARNDGYFPLERTSWLRAADPLLNDRIAYADPADEA